MSKKQSSLSSQVRKSEPKKEVIPVKKFTAQEAKSFILESTRTTVDPDELLKQFANEYMPLMYANDDSKQEEIMKKLTELSFAFSSETGYTLMKAVVEEQRGLALQMKRDLQNEFDCKTPSEKALIDLMVNSYIKKLHYSNRMVHNQQYVGHQYDSYRNYLSKEIDRSYRQFISALETLKFIKQPSMKVNIKTNNAFVGEKQQFNNNVENNEPK
jgi:hypothetical protein